MKIIIKIDENNGDNDDDNVEKMHRNDDEN